MGFSFFIIVYNKYSRYNIAMNNDDQKIVWKKGGTQNNDSALQIDEEQKIENDDIDLGSDVIQDLAQRSGDHQQNKNNSTEETSVDDLKAEIEKAFSNPENVEVPSESLASDVFDADSLDANFEDLKAHINENSGVNESLDAEMSSSNNDSEDSLKSLQDDIILNLDGLNDHNHLSPLKFRSAFNFCNFFCFFYYFIH